MNQNYSNILKIILINNIWKTITISEPWFSFIKKGKKRIEGRLNKGTFSELKAGNIVNWKHNDETCKTKIIKIVKYKTFEEYLLQEGLRRTLPNKKTLKEGLDVYYQYYTREQEKQFEIIAIYLKLI